MSDRMGLRRGAFLLLLAALLLGLARCGEEPTRSGEGYLDLRLKRPAGTGTEDIDTLAAEVWASGRRSSASCTIFCASAFGWPSWRMSTSVTCLTRSSAAGSWGRVSSPRIRANLPRRPCSSETIISALRLPIPFNC